MEFVTRIHRNVDNRWHDGEADQCQGQREGEHDADSDEQLDDGSQCQRQHRQ